MLKFFAHRRFNYIDQTAGFFAVAFFMKDRLFTGFLVLLVGIVISILAEAATKGE